ncbi:ABC transporter permease [Botrimarina mediterranea]|uniref:Lipoprotein-releasing system transmembrane protein LolE n=1 Tax=Botrimarina mediterranea TaxID=2528022 RepID=A0A518K517_9BACT|nr:FtsX-like permease family protein [Botrimarina mediterranea]QDV72876.1 Lipoprotein-releasing system transmembrane protein LolE [Botrimarina mediterranea]QDV77449.1 Lipoprotein-releasing system transmembrane protein LolE [Planctomycetes bacterium K2D]
MYKLVLCLRYLRTRWIALASIISVTLGVATMIVVNSVMAGFTHEMRDRIHGILSDVVFEARSLDGAPDAEKHMELIRAQAGDLIDGMSPTAQVPAMLGFTVSGQRVNRQVMLIGIDPESYGKISDFGRYLQHPANRGQLNFDLREGGYDTADPQAEDPAKAAPRPMMETAGWEHRRRKAFWTQREAELAARVAKSEVGSDQKLEVGSGKSEATEATATSTESAIPNPQSAVSADPFAQAEATSGDAGKTFDPSTEQHPGLVLGMALGSFRDATGEDRFLVLPGDDVEVTYPMSTTPPKPGNAFFTVVDFYESKMSEYDSSFVFVPLEVLQDKRGMIDPSTGVANFNSIQIRCKPGVDPNVVRDRLQEVFDPRAYVVSTWMDKQGALLAAVQMETAVLNVLLFMIIAVAGFGILAIFYMIVVEKTRDIGILKSLGASASGVMGIFLGYGLTLGIVGAGAGMIGGLVFVAYINEIADVLAWVTGTPVFDPAVYYFAKIPTIVHPQTVAWIVAGAMAIAVLASVLPARRAAALHPVEALRWE